MVSRRFSPPEMFDVLVLRCPPSLKVSSKIIRTMFKRAITIKALLCCVVIGLTAAVCAIAYVKWFKDKDDKHHPPSPPTPPPTPVLVDDLAEAQKRSLSEDVSSPSEPQVGFGVWILLAIAILFVTICIFASAAGKKAQTGACVVTSAPSPPRPPPRPRRAPRPLARAPSPPAPS